MDPFDDYDPRDFDYDDDDQSSQEGDIVYVEGPVSGEDPFLPYLARDVDLSQTQASQQEEQHQQQDLPNILPRRERQRRRTEVAAAQMMGESSESEISLEGSKEEEDRDPFASLQDLIEQQAQQEKEIVVKATVETDNAMMHENFDDNQCETGVVEERHPTQDVNVSFRSDSLSQFPMADDWDQTPAANLDPIRQHVPHPSSTSNGPIVDSSISSDLAKELQRQQRKKHETSHRKPLLIEPPSTVDKSLLVELERNRKRAQKETIDKPKNRIVGNGRGSQPRFHANRAISRIATSKSIVGTRPQHWAAARTPKLSAPRTRKVAASPKSSHLSTSVYKQQSRPRSKLGKATTKSSFLKNSVSRRSPTEAPSRISFAPRFFHTKQGSASQQDAVDDVDESTQGVMQRVVPYQTPRILQRFNRDASAAYSAGSSNGSNPSSRKRKHTKKIKAGPLMKRLRALRSAVEGDAIRFQSGMYPFAQSANRRFDLSDPRNRATSFVDVSIVDSPVPWDEHERKITALCFIHKSEKTSKSNDSNPAVSKGGRFAWVSFTYDTAREQNVCKGSKLRIYNTVSIPSSEPIQIDGLGDDAVVEDRCCDQTILCTQLCESYPDSLPALADIGRND